MDDSTLEAIARLSTYWNISVAVTGIVAFSFLGAAWRRWRAACWVLGGTFLLEALPLLALYVMSNDVTFGIFAHAIFRMWLASIPLLFLFLPIALLVRMLWDALGDMLSHAVNRWGARGGVVTAIALFVVFAVSLLITRAMGL